MKSKIFIITILSFFICLPVFANTYTADFETSSSQYASITDGSQTGLDFTTDLTIELWFNLETKQGQTLIVKRDASAGYRLEMNATTLTFWYRDSSTNREIQDTDFFSTVSTGSWYHVAVSIDIDSPASSKFYLNGVEQAVTTSGTNTSLSNTTGPFYIGANDGPIEYFDGKIDQVRIWNGMRSSNQILAHYNCEISDFATTSLVSLWNMDNDLNDSTANNNNLTNNNSITFTTVGIQDLDTCYSAEEEQSTSTQDFSETDLYTSRDLTTIEATTYIYTDSTTTPSELRRTVYHAPQFVVLLFLVLFLQIFELFRIEFLIRWRKKQK